MFANNLPGTEADEGLKPKKNNDQIVELAKPDQKVGQEIDRGNNIGQDQDEQQLRPQGDPIIPEQPPEKPQKIRQVHDDAENPLRPQTDQGSQIPKPHLPNLSE